VIRHEGDGWTIRLPRGESRAVGLEEAFLVRAEEAFKLFCRRQADYGPNNIARAGERGCGIRAQDKVARILTLTGSSLPAQGEPLRDAWIDLANYGLIGLMVHDGSWPIAPPVELENIARGVAELVRGGAPLPTIKEFLGKELFGE